MSTKGKKKSIVRYQGKDTAKTTRKRGIIWAALLLACGFIAVGAYLYMDSPGQQREISSPLASAAPTSDTGALTVSYPETLFADGKARHFEHKTPDGNTIRYFVLKSSDGVIRAAFDACDVCWPENKGYYQDGDYMVCKNCGRRFQSTKVNVVTGGCNPSALERNIKDGQVVIQVKHIEEGKRFFAGRSGQGRG